LTSQKSTCTNHTLTAHDGRRLFVRRWQSETESIGTLVLQHGYMEHSGRYEAFALAQVAQGITVVAADLRGHGLSDGPRGHIRGFDEYRQDLTHVLAAQGTGPKILMGHSLGGLIATDYALAGGGPLHGLIVTNPFYAPSMNIPLYKRALSAVVCRLMPGISLKAEMDPTGLSHDLQLVAESRNDPLIFDRATAGWYSQVLLAQARVRRGGVLSMPLLGVIGSADPIASPAAGRALLAKIRTADKTVWVREGELHEVLNETDRDALHKDIATWAKERLARQNGLGVP
jgi:acylglycerol lipase